jgi:hypothetical protein
MRKKTSSFVSLNIDTSMLLIVNIVDDICRMDSVKENCKAVILTVFCLKYKLTDFVFKRLFYAVDRDSCDKLISF